VHARMARALCGVVCCGMHLLEPGQEWDCIPLLAMEHKNSLFPCSNKRIRKGKKLKVNAQNTGHDHIRTQSEMDGLCRNELAQQFSTSDARLSPMTAKTNELHIRQRFPTRPGVL
jgi:hypothetical protein